MIRPAALLVLSVMLCACRQQQTAPSAHVAGPDVVLEHETETIDDTVPEHATLDSLLRQNQLSADLVRAAVDSAASVFNPRQLRADRPVSPGALARRPAARVRVSDRHRSTFSASSTAIASQPAALDARGAALREGQARHRHPRDHRRRAPVADLGACSAPARTSSWRWRSPRFSAGRSTSTATCSRATGSTCCSRNRRGTVSSRIRRHPRRALHRRRARVSRLSGGRTSARAAGYYDENGRSLKRFFLRTPLRFEPRITSGFSRSRLHPVLRTYRAHLGVDYAAPVGAAVVAVASGTVVSAGWAVAVATSPLKHAGGYRELLPAPLGVRPRHPRWRASRAGTADRPRRHDRTATGPHLDYRLRERRVREPARRAQPHAAGRVHPAGRPADVHDRMRDARARSCSRRLTRSPPRAPHQTPNARH